MTEREKLLTYIGELEKKVEKLEAEKWVENYFKIEARKELKRYKEDAKTLYNTLLAIGDGLDKEFKVYRNAVDNMKRLKGNPYHYNPPAMEE